MSSYVYQPLCKLLLMTGRKNRPLQVPHVVPYKALEKFPNAMYGTTEGTYSSRFFCPDMYISQISEGCPIYRSTTGRQTGDSL